MKKIILLLLAFGTLTLKANEEPVMTYGKPEISIRTQRLAKKFQSDIERGKLAIQTNRALDAIIRLAVYKLKMTGHKAEAATLLKEWIEQWDGEVIRLGRDLGDHKPISQWLAQKTALLKMILGESVFKALRLSDLDVLNYGIPVVISCLDNVDAHEYLLHFAPFCGTVSYWVSFFSCVGFTWGTGFLFCSPISMGVEYLALNIIAPKLNEPIWKLACHQGV